LKDNTTLNGCTRDTAAHGKVIAISVATCVAAIVALAGFFAWVYQRKKRLAQDTVPPIPPEPPTSHFREKAPFPYNVPLVSSPTTSTASPPPSTTRQRATGFSSSALQPRPLPAVPPDELRSAGAAPGPVPVPVPAVPVQAPHSAAALGHALGNQDTPTAAMPTMAPILSPRSTLGDLDVPPPAYSPVQ
jgi:hypothetical protein